MFRIVLVAVALLAAVSSGCSRLRLPAIDPTGSCLFSPLPTTTGLALPGSGGEGCGCFGCLGRLTGGLGNCASGCLNKPRFGIPEPAFPMPADAPPCAVPGAGVALGQSNQPCVPSSPCPGDCKDGPPAVLLGGEIDQQGSCCLPDRGKRGCILLSPNKIVAPVGGEVVLLSGICGTDGYLQMNEKLEWMLTPDSVGTFIEVGDDDPGFVGKLVGSSVRPEKRDPSYAIGITSTKPTLITRGNRDPRDDVKLEKGQTWITLSSPSEGVSRVTVLAPESDCWDQRKSTATIYWVDASWQFPSAQIVPKGTPVDLTTRVTRSDKVLPAKGWKVRYEIQQPEFATFEGTGGSSVVEVNVDDSGNATATLVPVPGTSGTTAVTMQVIRPGGVSDNLPDLTLGSGQTYVTWSSPQLELRAGAPDIASFDTPYQVVANVRNPGDQPANNVRVDVQLPQGTRVIGADSFARVAPGGVTWELGTIPPQSQIDLFLNLASQSPVSITFGARADGLSAEDTVRVDVFRPVLGLAVAPVQERVEAGQPVTFNIDVTNNGDRPLPGAYVVAKGDSSIIHESGGVSVRDDKPEVLQPGETWRKKVIFTPTQSGRRCIQVEAFADAGQRASQEACVLVINPIPQTPNLTATLESKSQVSVGQTTLVRSRIVNDGRAPAQNVTVNMVYDPQLELQQATEGASPQNLGQRIITWTVPTIAPGQSVLLEAVFAAIRPTPQTRVSVTAEGLGGVQASDAIAFPILAATAPPTQQPQPTRPPFVAPPDIPGGSAPQPNPSAGLGTGPGNGQPAVPPPANTPLQGTPPTLPPPGFQGNNPIPATGQLQTSIFFRDNPVQINDPIRLAVRVTNNTSVRDGQIGLQFAVPDGVRMERLVPMTNPELSEYQFNGNIVNLPLIPSLEPGQSADFIIVLSSNQPQTFDIEMLTRSVNQPGGYLQRASATVTQ